ncbi:MAG: putative metalloprotease CJM1_0395 family protein [Gammaproteobacteria bacterium]|nr:putative metalloprotease CJM1_0395 family protein [Gammaproteobacteria bacterium]
MLPISAPFPVGFGGGITPPPAPANPVPGQAAAAYQAVAPVSQNQTQTNNAVPPTGNADRPDTDTQGNNTETPTRGQYGSSDPDKDSENDGSQQKLSKEEQVEVKELSSRDREVRAHEAAHLAAAGPYARGGASYDYQRGPDGKSYAVGGEVSIDTSEVAGDPHASLRKAETIHAAATAPADPSSQDRKVAVAAAQMAARARVQILEQRQREQGYPEDYTPPAIRAYNDMSSYFQQQTQAGAPVSVHA